MIEGARLQNLKPKMRLPLILMLASFSGGHLLVDYSAELQTKAAKELSALPRDSAVARLVVDYGQLRRTCRL